MKKDQNLQNKNIHSNNSSRKPLHVNYNVSRQKSAYRYNYRGRSPDQRKSKNFSHNTYSRSNSQNNRMNCSTSNSNRSNYSNITGIVQTQTPETNNIQLIVLETPHTIETETI